MSSDQSKKPSFPDTEPAAENSKMAQVPDTAPTTVSSSPPVPDTKPTTKIDAQKVAASSPKTNTPTKGSTRAIKPDRVLPPLVRNARPYSGQRLGVKHDRGIDPIEGHFLNLALVDLKWVEDHLEPYERTRVLDVAPWTGCPIVELS